MIRGALLFGALLVAVFFASRIFFNLNFLAINSINVIGAQKTSTEQIKSVVASELAGKWLGIIPKNNFLFLGKSAIADAILRSFPDIANVRAALAGVGVLNIEIEERLPYAKWCAVANLDGNCLMIDEQGFAFEKAGPTLTASSAQIRQRADLGGQTATTTAALTVFTAAEPKYAANIFAQTKFEKLHQFIESFKSAGFAVASVKEEDTDYFFTLSDGSEIRVRSEDNPDDIVTKLSSIGADLQKDGKAASVEYIDLRYGNKVYLKMK
jgi:cell division septal protein FtsQ